jgi:DNA-binding NtrC family response regulator
MAAMERRLEERFGLERLTGGSQAIRRVLEQVRHVAPTRAAVLIEGEDGTGKGLVARSIHQNSSRKHEPFVWLDCGSLDPDLIEAELFGTALSPAGEPGGSEGRLEIADGGTLFLDRVSELPAAVQVRLLRAIQERAFERVGGRETLRADVRFLSASNRDLAGEVRRERFREDLYDRLSVAHIVMPPLRERRADIPFLVDEFIRELSRRHRRRIKGITRGALERLQAHDWRGNVRELKLTIEGMIVFAEGHRTLEFSDLPEPLRQASPGGALDVRVGMTVDEAERKLVVATLRAAGNDKPRAARMRGIGLRTLYRKIQTYGLE